MITTANQHMIPALKTLWIEAFKDPESYVNFFFENRFDADTTFVYLVNGIPVSMAFVLEAELYHNENYTQVGYVYAVATAKKFQGRGFSTDVLEEIKKRYATTFLVPATESLFHFYKKQGYKNAFSLSHFTYQSDKETTVNVSSVNQSFCFEAVSPEEYKKIRDVHFKKEGYIRWDIKGIIYALKENSFCGGSAVKVVSHTEGKTLGILLYRCVQNELYIKETTLSGQILYDALDRLMEEHRTFVAHVRLSPYDASRDSLHSSYVCKPFGMLCSSISLNTGYCNLILD